MRRMLTSSVCSAQFLIGFMVRLGCPQGPNLYLETCAPSWTLDPTVAQSSQLQLPSLPTERVAFGSLSQVSQPVQSPDGHSFNAAPPVLPRLPLTLRTASAHAQRLATCDLGKLAESRGT